MSDAAPFRRGSVPSIELRGARRYRRPARRYDRMRQNAGLACAARGRTAAALRVRRGERRGLACLPSLPGVESQASAMSFLNASCATWARTCATLTCHPAAIALTAASAVASASGLPEGPGACLSLRRYLGPRVERECPLDPVREVTLALQALVPHEHKPAHRPASKIHRDAPRPGADGVHGPVDPSVPRQQRDPCRLQPRGSSGGQRARARPNAFPDAAPSWPGGAQPNNRRPGGIHPRQPPVRDPGSRRRLELCPQDAQAQPVAANKLPRLSCSRSRESLRQHRHRLDLGPHGHVGRKAQPVARKTRDSCDQRSPGRIE